ncbi:putative phoD-like phosphatase [Lyophyllum shimeji]|uniref:PhoD-like phosphatase n=1 Tax=Lyophyllum shimeji TaxID=47721 RepID=A0A9P3PGU4_LYOSH|nr:putative phoD-like phosphatase [Lyophyllum shimeji]
MSIFIYLPTLLSSLFRLSVYIFLRVIPTSLAKLALPALYIAHLLSLWLFAPRPLDATISEKDTKKTPATENRILPTLFLSLPTSSRRLRLSNALINTVLLLVAADLVVTPFLDTATDASFTRVGAVHPDSVKVVVRYPETSHGGPTPSRLVYRESTKLNTTSWRDGPQLTFTQDEDWVDTVKVTGLWPNTTYEYALSTANRTILEFPGSPFRFRTFPDPRLSTGTHFKFVASSCIYSNFPYRGPLHRRTIRGFDLLADYLYPPSIESLIAANEAVMPAYNLRTSPKADFMLFLGDFIYADVPVYIGDNKEAYRRLYRRNYNSDSFRKIYERLPIFHAYDDHEFINNFGAGGIDSTPPFTNASSAFKLYNANANFDPVRPGEYYYEFQYGDAAFFVLDTRRYRTEKGTPNRTMLGEAQLASLHEWLSRVNTTSTFKFVVTSVPFTSLWTHDAQSDSWAGFPDEKQTLLTAFHSVPNVVLLSGDRHEFAAVEFTGPNPDDHPVWEFSTSPLSMFYIPLVRTLRMQSDAFTQRNRAMIVSTEDGREEIVNYVEDIPLERVIKYIPIGNFKWSAFEVDTTDPENPLLKLETVVDGKPGFHFEITGIAVKSRPSTALSAFVAGGVKDIINKLGINPGKWF